MARMTDATDRPLPLSRLAAAIEKETGGVPADGTWEKKLWAICASENILIVEHAAPSTDVIGMIADDIDRNGKVARALVRELRKPSDLRRALLAEVGDYIDAKETNECHSQEKPKSNITIPTSGKSISISTDAIKDVGSATGGTTLMAGNLSSIRGIKKAADGLSNNLRGAVSVDQIRFALMDFSSNIKDI